MHIVIDISEEDYKTYVSDFNLLIPIELSNAIRNGIALPKGHGELIDREQALNECYRINVDGDMFKVVQYETLLGVPTIIEADKEE